MSTQANPDLADAAPVTAVRTLERSFHRAVAGGGIAWELFMVLAVLTAPVRIPAAILVSAHLVVALVAVITWWRSASAFPLLLAVYLLGFVDVAAAVSPEGTLTFGAIWSLSVVAASPAFIMARFRSIALGLCVLGLAAVELGLIHPDWPPSVAAFAITTAAALMVATQILMTWVRAAAERADDTEVAAHKAAHRARVAELTGLEIDEGARLLHDTLINTLGAVASGRGAIRDRFAVRDRCARDAAVVARLLDQDSVPTPAASGLAGLGATEPGIAVQLEIPSDAALRRFEEMMPARTRWALIAATQEAIRNAAKHSGTDQVRVTVVLAGPDITVRVRDDGVGFDVAEATGAQRGMVHSIQRRCEGAGVEVAIDSTPGDGATIRFAWSMADTSIAEVKQPHGKQPDDVDVVTRAVAWAWAVAILTAALVTIRVSPPVPGHLADWAVALVGVLCLGSWMLSRTRRSLPMWAAVVVALGIPASFVLSFAGVYLGAIPLVMMQSLVVTPLVVILVLRVSSKVPLLIGLAGLAVAVAGPVAMTAVAEPGRALDAVIAAGPLVALAGSWTAFAPMLTRIATQRAVARLAASEAAATMAVHGAVREARTRWVNAGVREAGDLVRALGDGELDPWDPQVQRWCGQTEHHLRALLAIDNDQVHLGPWLAAALLRARSRTVLASIVGGTVDAPDADAAAELGRMLVAVLSLCSHGSRVVIGAFGEPGDPVFSIVGPAELAEQVPVPDGVRWQVTGAVHDDHWRAEARLR